jgi:hypothetical protein
MKAARAFTSKMAPHIERYLALKQALGREYDGVRRVLVHLDQFLTTHGGDLTAETFAGWCLTLQHLASGTRRCRMREVRNSVFTDAAMRRRVLFQISDYFRGVIRWFGHTSSRTQKSFASWPLSARCPPLQRHHSVGKTCAWR